MTMTTQEQIDHLNKASDQALTQLGRLIWQQEQTQAALNNIRVQLANIEQAKQQLMRGVPIHE